ncbi:MAG: hypothetical protein FWG75_07965 [Cystobacterineae bacterium]|nr:hypothetical protein [Cystobacterineae bacterium]
MKSSATPLQLELFASGPPEVTKPLKVALINSMQALSFQELPSQVLARELSARLGFPVCLLLNSNQRTMLSCKHKAAGLEVRMHRMFLSADLRTRKALGDYLGRRCKRASRQLNAFIREQLPKFPSPPKAAKPLRALGKHYNLQEIFTRLNQLYFDNQIVASVGWAQVPKRKARSSLRLGVYEHERKQIRIHPSLDSPEVPPFYVDFVVFHEMLHQRFAPTEASARRCLHSRAFRAHEKSFPAFTLAMAWEKAKLNQVLFRRTPKPPPADKG